MDVTPLIRKGQNIIQGYKGGSFKISGNTYENALIISPHELLEWNIPEDFSSLEFEHFKEIINRRNEFDVFLFGTGKTIKFLPKDLKIQLKNEGVALDVMDTGAACRTYNVLMAEGRRVVVLLKPV
tara:strand:+ start:2411 stop:2788 length:378 start_codon:yes stop_codon:yes gene_type:complete